MEDKCVYCGKTFDDTEEIHVTRIQEGTIKFGLFNRIINYPTMYIHDECYERYLKRRVGDENHSG